MFVLLSCYKVYNALMFCWLSSSRIYPAKRDAGIQRRRIQLPLVGERGGAPPVAGRGCRWPVQFILIFTPPLHFVQFPPRFARGSTYKKTTYMTWVIYHTKNRIGDIWKVTCPQLLSTTGENYRFRNTRTLASCEPSLRPAIKPSKKNSLDPSK